MNHMSHSKNILFFVEIIAFRDSLLYVRINCMKVKSLQFLDSITLAN